jgi:hypothetical protein
MELGGRRSRISLLTGDGMANPFVGDDPFEVSVVAAGSFGRAAWSRSSFSARRNWWG